MGRSRAKSLALDTYEHEEMKNLTTAELRREWDHARRIVHGIPPDLSAELAQLRAERKHLREVLARQRNIQRDARRELAGMGAMGLRRSRSKRKAVERRIADAAAGEAKVASALGALDRRDHNAGSRQAERELWVVRHGSVIRRLGAVGRELWLREQQRAIAAEAAMPRYLVQAVGNRPMKPSDRALWHEAVRAIERYRERWSITDQRRALGTAPDNTAQRLERDSVKQQIRNLTQRSPERRVDVRERALDG